MELFATQVTAGLRAFVGKEMDMQLSVQSSARELEESMEVLRSKLHGLRKEKICDLDIRKWIATLENIVYDADDVLDECYFRNSQLRPLSTPPSLASDGASVPVWRNFPLILTLVTRPYQFYFKQFCSNRDMSLKLQALNSRLQMLKIQRDNRLDLYFLNNYQDIPPVTDPEAYTMPSVVSSSVVVGDTLRKDADFMVRLLADHQTSDALPVYAIVGPPGIGKTLMANVISESLHQNNNFDKIIRVTVPRKFDKLNLLKRILTAAGVQCDEGNALLLERAIKGKKLLLLLDDVLDAMGLWNLWLGFLFRGSCATGSRVLITTRNQDAADQMKAIYSHSVQPLTNDEGWELLCRCVGSASEADQMKILKETGVQIVDEKCYGNPLAIMSMGAMLCLENNARVAWERILECEDIIWSKGLSNLPDGIHKAIYCTFDKLPSAQLRHCFVYCSLFPDGYEISCSDLIEMWVAEGIVEDDEAALSCFMHLTRRNVLIPQLSPEFTFACKMDGLSSSLGRFIMQDSGMVIPQHLPLPLEPDLPVINYKNKLRRLSLVIKDGNTGNAEKPKYEDKIHEFLKKQPSLRTLLLFNHPLPRADKLLHHLPSIRLLSLKKAAISELPDSIGSLMHLRFLDLSENNKLNFLPESIGKLANLKTLRLQACKNLAQLPKSFLNLKKLMYFDARETSLGGLPEGMGDEMHELRKIIPLRLHAEEGKMLATKKDLEKMEMLRSLGLEISCEVLQNLPENILKHKMNLRELVLRLMPEEAVDNCVDVSMTLCPPQVLEDLRIVHYHGSRLPDWLKLTWLTNLRNLQIESCSFNLKEISGLCQLPCLEHLLLKQTRQLQGEEEESEPSSSSLSSFPKLKVLHLEDMADGEKWGWPNMELPVLHTLKICNFPKLKSLPKGLLSSTFFLHTLNICNCPELKLSAEGLLCHLKMLRLLLIEESPDFTFERKNENFPSFLEIKVKRS